MSNYIKREDAIKANEDYVPYQRLGEDRQSYMDRVLKELPSADVEPVRHGAWKEVLVGMDFEYECTRCKTCVEQEYPYCPNCGAKMNGVEERKHDE